MRRNYKIPLSQKFPPKAGKSAEFVASIL